MEQENQEQQEAPKQESLANGFEGIPVMEIQTMDLPTMELPVMNLGF